MKVFFGVSIDSEISQRARNAAYWTPGMSLSRLVSEALSLYINKLEEENGEAFKLAEGELQRGRR